MANMFSNAYKREHLSDYDLVLIREDQPEPTSSTLPDDSCSIPVHGLLLSAKSAYFTLKIEEPLGTPAPTRRNKKLMFVQLDPALWDDFDHMLYCIYHDKVPKDLSPRQVLRVTQLADRYQVPSCLGCCSKHFASIPASDLDWDDVATFYSIEETLRSTVLKSAGKVFFKKLEGTFLKLEKAWRSEELRQVFLELPLGAILQLAADEQLQVISENTVATALASWIAHVKEARMPYSTDLLKHLRIHHLTQSYIADILRHLPGIGDQLSIDQLLIALQYQTATPTEREVNKLGMNIGHRFASCSPELTFDWHLPLAQVVQMIERRLAGEEDIIRSHECSYNGFTLCMSLEAAATAHGTPCLYVQLEAKVVCGKADVLVPRSLVITATVEMPGREEGRMRCFDTQASMRMAECGQLTYIIRIIQLGPEHVHDAATLLGAIASKKESVRKTVEPVSASRVQQLQELLFSCTVIGCA